MNDNSKELLDIDRECVWHPFTQAATAPEPIAVASGRGSTLITTDGREILDLISSWWVNIHGHAHPAIAAAIAKQAATLEQVIFAGFTHEPAVRLARAILDLLPPGFDRVFYSDNGSTAVEVALKIAYQFFQNAGQPQRRRIAAFTGGYHGDTFGAMSAGRTSGFYAPFAPLLFDVDFLPYPATWLDDADVEAKETASLAALDALITAHPDGHCAVIIEPLIQGASGMNMCRESFLRDLCAKARQAGILVIYDEVMTGFGRTGEMFACVRSRTRPDIICLSKGLTGGYLPLSATVCGEDIYKAFLGATFDRAFAHGHSFTANPLGCAAALASIALFTEEDTLARVRAIESLHRERLSRLSLLPHASRARVTGCVAAFDVSTNDPGYDSTIGPRLRDYFLSRNLLLRPLGNVVYMMPPYCTPLASLHQAWDTIESSLREILPPGR